MDKKALHEELHRLIERKKELYAEKDMLYDQLSRLKTRKQAAHRRANEKVTHNAGLFGLLFGTTHSSKKTAFEQAKRIGRDMDRTYDDLCSVKGKLKYVRAQINDLKEKLFNGK